jgi:hypothetical protein
MEPVHSDHKRTVSATERIAAVEVDSGYAAEENGFCGWRSNLGVWRRTISRARMLHHWTNFFLTTAAAGAQLIGLLFVVATVGTSLSRPQSVAGIRAFLTPTLICFSEVMSRQSNLKALCALAYIFCF